MEMVSKNKSEEQKEFAFLTLYYLMAPLLAFALGLTVYGTAPNMLPFYAFAVLTISFIMFLMAIRILFDPLARKFLLKKGKLYVIVLGSDRKIRIQQAKRVAKNTIKAGDSYYFVRPSDLFVGGKGTVWAVVVEAGGVLNPLNLLYRKDADVEGSLVAPNLQIGDRRFYMFPEPEGLREALEDLEKKGYQAIAFSGFSVPTDVARDIALIDHKIKVMAEEICYQEKLVKEDRFKEYFKWAMLMIPIAIAGAIIISVLRGG